MRKKIPEYRLTDPEKIAKESKIHDITTVSNPKQTPITMDKKWYQSKTIWSAILIAITAILQSVGLDFAGNPETMEIIYSVMYPLAGAFGLYGLRDAIGKKIGKDE